MLTLICLPLCSKLCQYNSPRPTQRYGLKTQICNYMRVVSESTNTSHIVMEFCMTFVMATAWIGKITERSIRMLWEHVCERVSMVSLPTCPFGTCNINMVVTTCMPTYSEGSICTMHNVLVALQACCHFIPERAILAVQLTP